jgi:hypothetical protein
VVIGAIEAPRRRRRSRAAEPGATPVEVTRATVVTAERLEGEARADEWLKRAAGREAAGTVAAALAVLNRALHARRIAAADPYAGEVSLRDALVTRVGYGTGEHVAEGRWVAARELPEERPRSARESALRPQERFAALLAARDVALACELLALRARLDLEQGRDREAALQLEAALGAASSELEGWRELDGMLERLSELSALEPRVAEVAAAARAGGLDADASAAVERALGRLEAALRARTAGAAF